MTTINCVNEVNPSEMMMICIYAVFQNRKCKQASNPSLRQPLSWSLSFFSLLCLLCLYVHYFHSYRHIDGPIYNWVKGFDKRIKRRKKMRQRIGSSQRQAEKYESLNVYSDVLRLKHISNIFISLFRFEFSVFLLLLLLSLLLSVFFVVLFALFLCALCCFSCFQYP